MSDLQKTPKQNKVNGEIIQVFVDSGYIFWSCFAERSMLVHWSLLRAFWFTMQMVKPLVWLHHSQLQMLIRCFSVMSAQGSAPGYLFSLRSQHAILPPDSKRVSLFFSLNNTKCSVNMKECSESQNTSNQTAGEKVWCTLKHILSCSVCHILIFHLVRCMQP